MTYTSAEGRSQFRWGITGVVVAVLALAISAVIFLVPFGRTTYVAEFRTSAGARSGDEVRIAGIKVGTVESVRLVGDHVEVRFGVDSDVHVGDSSSVEVKMLTPIGGHYLALSPSGSGDLGAGHIPPERTRTPYELTDVLQDATRAVRNVDGSTLRSTIAEVNRALQGQPDAVHRLLTNVNDITGVLADRSDQLDRAMQVSDEYIAAIADDQAVLADFVRQLGIVAVKLGAQRDDVVQTFQLLRRLADVVHRPIMAFADGLEPSITELETLFNAVLADQDRIDEVITGIKDFMAKISTIIGDDGVPSGPQPAPSGVCVPTPAQAC